MEITRAMLVEVIELNLTVPQIAERLKCSTGMVEVALRRESLRTQECEPVESKEVSRLVNSIWEDGFYADKIENSLKFKGEDGVIYNLKYDYPEYLAKYQDLCLCARCEDYRNDVKVIHVDGTFYNFLITNLEPVCNDCYQETINNPFVTIGVKSHFDSSHNLLWYDGDCAKLHGHRYYYEVLIEKRLNSGGMVTDFKKLKKTLEIFIEKILDHAYLNDILPFNPTAENMVVWMFELLQKRALVKGIQKVSLWETPDCVASVTKDQMIRNYLP